MRNNPTGVRFADACKVVTKLFGEPRQDGTSHKVWKMPWAGDPRVNMQRGKSGKAKPYQLRQAVQAIDRFAAERAAARRADDTEEGRAAQATKTTRKTRKTKARKPKTKRRRS